MKLATWNVNGLRARLDFLKIWLADRRPDVVGLQELKLDDEAWARDELAAVGYDALLHGQKGWNGVAILVRQGIPAAVETARGLPGQEELGARLLSADVAGVSFTTIYVPNGKSVDHEDFPRKLAWLDALVAHARPGDRPALLCGDFNLCPTALDTFSEEDLAGTIFHTPEERARFAALESAGWRDLFRATRPADRLYSWWDYRAGAFHMNRGLRIDLILGTAPVLADVRSVTIDRDFRKKKDALTPSDHAPVLVELAR